MPPRSNRKKNKGKKAEAAPLKNNDTSKSMSMNSTVAFYKCSGCDNVGANFKVCSKCKTVKYCSAACQKEHWPQHKKDCRVISLNFLGLGKPKLRFKVGGKFRRVAYLYDINSFLFHSTSDNILHVYF